VMDLDHARLPDPVARAINSLTEQINRMAVRINEMEERQDCLEDKITEEPAPANSGNALPKQQR